MNAFSEILAEMTALAESDDPEVAHARVDSLLLDALRLSVHHPLTEAQFQAIDHAYRSVGKWYA